MTHLVPAPHRHARIGLRRAAHWFALTALTASLMACGGGDDEAMPVAPPTPAPVPSPAPSPAPLPAPSPAPAPVPSVDARGGLHNVALVNTIALADIQVALGNPENKLGPDTTLQPIYGVQNHRLHYTTTDRNGALVKASALVSVPIKPAGAPSPVLSYQHATTFFNDEAPSIKVEAFEPPIVLASLGYIVVAADYVGFGSTQGLHHPYLHAEPSANAVVDLLVAAQTWRKQAGVRDNGQLFLTGYSEGGYVTMAAQRAIEQAGGTLQRQLTATVAGAGPYDVQVTLDGLVDELPSALGALLKPSRISEAPEWLREEVRRFLMSQLVPSRADVTYDVRFVDRYLADQPDRIAAEHSVHTGWVPTVPVYLFHGRGDKTVPYAASVQALQSLQAAGAGNVTLTDCTTGDLGHLGCVPEYFEFTVSKLAALARDL